MFRNFALLTLVLAAMAVPALADDHDDVVAVIHEYLRTEDAGDLATQAKIMSPDRVWLVTGAGRRLDQAENFEIQKKSSAAAERAGNAVATVSEARDIEVRMHADGRVAIASFYWYLTPLGGDGSSPTPNLVTHVLEKGSDGWKIVHTHISPLYTN
jgi:uncharacterized protein (TIGR02246 family)